MKNIFDDLPALKPPETKELEDELARYLSTPRDLNVKDGLRWWYDRKHLYPCLHRMAMDYLSIPGKFFFFVFAINCLLIHICLTATSVDVEQIFSQGRLLLSHVRSRLSVQSTRALLCVGAWSLLGYIKDEDVKAATVMPEVKGEEEELATNWDSTV